MDCRNARPLIASLQRLTDTERHRLEVHLQGCAACTDEATDPDGVLLASFRPQMVMAPPDLTRNVLQRVPAMTPLEVAARERRTSLRARYVAFGSATLVGLIALVTLVMRLGFSARVADRLSGGGVVFGLLAKGLLVALGQPWLVALVVIIGFAFATALPRMLAPTASGASTRLRRYTVAGTALAALLLVLNVGATAVDTGSITSAIQVSNRVDGDVATIAGDIQIGGEVLGDVVSLAGHITLLPGAYVHGSVLSGAGITQTEGARIAQGAMTITDQLPALNRVLPIPATVDISPTLSTRLAGSLVVLVALVLAGFVVIIWPQGIVPSSTYLLRSPGRAMALGALMTPVLLLLSGGITVALAATLVGLVLVPILLLLVHVPYVVGLAAVGQALGARLTGSPSVGSAIWGVAVQLLAVLVCGLLVPWLGLIVFYTLGSAGLGAALLDVRGHALDTLW